MVYKGWSIRSLVDYFPRPLSFSHHICNIFKVFGTDKVKVNFDVTIKNPFVFSK